MKLAVCWKWVSIGDQGGPSNSDTRWAGVSPADEAALEVALRLAEQASTDQAEITVVCLGPAAADTALRTALAAGATRAVRIDASTDLASADVAAALALAVAGNDLVVCGDYSLDRGTASVPAFLAHHLGAAQALGLVAVDPSSTEPGTIRGVRRLDGGRREVLDVRAPAVLSVEGSVARLRRAGLGDVVAAKAAPIDVVPENHQAAWGDPVVAAVVTPYRPRARVLPGPTGGVLTRVRDLLDIGGGATVNGELVTHEPIDAARRIVDQLEAWGYLPGPDAASGIHG